MDAPLSRRSALIRAFAALSAAELFAVGAHGDRRMVDASDRHQIVPGQRFGEIYLGMSERELLACLGRPEYRKVYAAERLSDTLRIFAYINQQTGQELTEADAYPLQPETTCIGFKSKGISVNVVGGNVEAIFAYTGIVSGYEKGDYTSCFPLDGLSEVGEPVANLEDVRRILGDPNSESPLTQAPVPSNSLLYTGLSFSGRIGDGRISHLTISKPKPPRK